MDFSIADFKRWQDEGNIFKLVGSGELFYIGDFCQNGEVIIHFVKKSRIATDLEDLNERLRVKACTDYSRDLNTAFHKFADLLSKEIPTLKWVGYMTIRVNLTFFKHNHVEMLEYARRNEPFIPVDIL